MALPSAITLITRSASERCTLNTTAKPDSVSIVTLLFLPRLASCETTELMAEMELAIAATRAGSPCRIADATSKPSIVATTTAVTPSTLPKKLSASRAATTCALGARLIFTDMGSFSKHAGFELGQQGIDEQDHVVALAHIDFQDGQHALMSCQFIDVVIERR